MSDANDCEASISVVILEADCISCPPPLSGCEISEFDPFEDIDDFIAAGGSVDFPCMIAGIELISQVSDGNTCPEIVTRTYEITDECGNTQSCTQEVELNDEVVPQLVCPPEVDENTGIDIGPASPGGTSSLKPTNTGAINNVLEYILLANLHELISKGDSAEAKLKALLEIEDVDPPVISSEAPVFFALCSIDEYPPFESFQEWLDAGGQASDNCGLDEDSFRLVNEESDGGNCPETITRTYEIADLCGNKATCQQVIVIDDEEDPVLNCPTNLTAFCSLDEQPAYTSFAEFELAGGTASDNCGIDESSFMLLSEVSDGECPEVVTRTYQVSDRCGNLTTCVQTITINDELAPEAPEDPAELILSCLDDVPDPNELTANDNCSGEITVSGVDENNGGVGCSDDPLVITRTWTFTDDCGNTSTTTQIIRVVDESAPELIGDLPEGEAGIVACADDIPDGATEADIKALYDDDCSEVTVTKSGTPVGDDCSWTVTYTYTIVDDCGNAADQFELTFSGGDTEAPQLVGTIPANESDILACYADIPAGPTEADIAALYTDNCSQANVTKSGTPTGDDCSWTVTYTYVIVDDCGNAADQVEITYSGGDTEAPQLVGTIPADESDILACYADIPAGPTEADIAALYTDNCSQANVTKSGTPTGDDCSWTVTYTYVIVDDCGNAADQVEITYSGGDTEAPQLVGTIPAGETDILACTADIPAGPTEADIAALYTDNCSQANVTKSGTPTGDDCSWSVTYTYVIVDDCGNAADQVEITYSGGDIEAPQLTGTIPANESDLLLCYAEIPAGPTEADIAAQYTDNCSDVSVAKSGTPTGDDCSWTVTYTYVITDDCGNEADQVQITYSGGDTEAPQLVGTIPSDESDILACYADIPAGPTEADIAALYTDNCSQANVSKSGTPTGDDCSWTVTYTYVIVDDCGNAADQVAITYSGGDTEAPQLVGTLPEGETDILACAGDIPAGATEEEIAALYTDNCSEVTVTKSGTPVGDDCSWTVTYVYTIVDDCGNAADQFELTFSGGDTEAPQLVGTIPANESDILACYADIPAGPTEADIAALYTDNCSQANVTKSGTPTGDDCSWTVTYTYVIVDDCGNAADQVETHLTAAAIRKPHNWWVPSRRMRAISWLAMPISRRVRRKRI